jgi:hypothetical protein
MFTDKTIEVKCAECDQTEVGLDALILHLKTVHPEYGDKAQYFAEEWVEDAYRNMEEFEESYDEQRRIDQAIDSDIEYQKENP